MDNQRRTICQVIKCLHDPAGAEVAAVLCSDGTYAVTIGGRLLETLRWDSDQLEDCLRFLEGFVEAE